MNAGEPRDGFETDHSITARPLQAPTLVSEDGKGLEAVSYHNALESVHL